MEETLLTATTEIVASFVANNPIAADAIPGLIRTVYSALTGVNQPAEAPVDNVIQKPAVAIKKSVADDYIVCLEDGKKLKMLKRYLASKHGMTPDQYRAKWGLPKDYPMVAPNYAKTRSEMALKIGLGRSKAA